MEIFGGPDCIYRIRGTKINYELQALIFPRFVRCSFSTDSLSLHDGNLTLKNLFDSQF